MRRPAPPPEPLDANRIVRSVLHGWSAPVSSDVVDDCRQEACLALWSIGLRIQALPPDQRCPYATACIQHAVRRYLIREGRQRCGAIPMDGLGCLSARAVASAPDFTFEQELMDLLGRLGVDDREVLTLSLVGGLTDCEIGAELNISLPAAKKRRQRAYARLRHILLE